MAWSHLGLNQGPPDYESDALTNWAIGPAFSLYPEKRVQSYAFYFKNASIQQIFCYSFGIVAANLLILRIWNIINIAVITVATKSDVKYATQIPVSPQIFEKMKIKGNRNSIWRVKLRKIDFPAIPKDWK